MEFRLLGPLEVAEGGRPVSLGGSRARALLALLLLNRNQLVAVDRIVDELWAGRPPKTGAQVVRVYVSQLRKALETSRSDGQTVLVTQRNGYLLRVGPDKVDADRFEALRAEGHRLLAEGEMADAARTLEESLSLWRGPPLQDFTYEAFAQPEIARLEELRLATLEDLFDAQLGAGRDSELVADLEQLVNANPLRERLRAQLMLALYRAGRPADALETYQRGRRLLVDELGLEPGETLRQLETQILQQDSRLDRPSPPPPATQTRAQPPHSRARRLAMRSLVLVLLSAAAIAGVLTAATPGQSQKRLRHVALVINGPRNFSNTSPSEIGLINGVRIAAKKVGLRSRVRYGGLHLSGFLRETRTAARTSNHVIVDATSNLEAISKLTPQFPDTRFLVLNSVLDKRASFAGQRNVTGMNFHDWENGYLGGYLAALMTHTEQRVSVVAGAPTTAVRDLIAGFKAGAHLARPDISVVHTYTGTYLTTQAPCFSAANRQIDHGSAVIFDAAGYCGFGALQAAELRDVWGLSVGPVPSWLPKRLGSVTERTNSAVELAVKLFADRLLPRGQNLQLDLTTGDIGLRPSNSVPPTIRAKIATLEQKLLARDDARHSH